MIDNLNFFVLQMYQNTFLESFSLPFFLKNNLYFLVY